MLEGGGGFVNDGGKTRLLLGIQGEDLPLKTLHNGAVAMETDHDHIGGFLTGGAQIVKFESKRVIPSSLDDAKFCKTCIANDFMIPGIEFDAEGRCPICRSAEKTKNLIHTVDF